MKEAISFEKLFRDSLAARQTLGRTPEPEPITNDPNSVHEYDRVLETNMTANYAAVLDTIHRCRGLIGGKVLDLCSGPGHLTGLFSKFLGYESVTGIDLSPRMAQLANENSKKIGVSAEVKFQVADVTDLSKFKSQRFELITFCNAAHHMPNLEIIEKILWESEKICNPDGLIVLSDIGRLKTQQITEDFVQLAGLEFHALKMPNMFNDFRNSMYAAWLPEELSRAVPSGTSRSWFQIIPTGFPCFHILVGAPSNRKDLYLRGGTDWVTSGLVSSEKAKNDWLVMKQIIDGANCVPLKMGLVRPA